MAPFFKTSALWIVEYLHDGHPRRWMHAVRDGSDPTAAMRERLAQWYGPRARLVQVRPVTPQEEDDYLHGRGPQAPMCPTARR